MEHVKSFLEQPFMQPFVDSVLAKLQEATGATQEKIFVLLVLVVIFVADVLRQLLLSPPSSAKSEKALVPGEFLPFKLIEKEEVSHDVRRFRFALPSKDHILGLPIGQHITFKYIEKVDGEEKDVSRSYTPTTSDDEKGYVDFVIKVYFPHPTEERWKFGGKMSQHLNNMSIGDTMLMTGPKGHLDYKGCGAFTIKPVGKPLKEYKMRKIGMIAGGTGITPMLQVIRAVLKNPKDKTELWLLFANKTEEDILLRKELEAIASPRFHLHYTLDSNPPAGWKHQVGFISEEMCRKCLPPPAEDTMIFNCAPPPMIQYAIEPNLKKVGFAEGQWFTF